MKKEPRNYRPSLLRQSLKKRSQKCSGTVFSGCRQQRLKKNMNGTVNWPSAMKKEGNEKFLEELQECRRIRMEIRNLRSAVPTR